MDVPAAFLSDLCIRDIDGKHFVLLEPLRFWSPELHTVVVAPAGYTTDFASIPPGLWNIFPKLGTYDYPAVIHDAGYDLQLQYLLGEAMVLSKAQCDNLFREGMKARGVGKVRRYLMYWAVRVFGKGKVKNLGADRVAAIKETYAQQSRTP